MVASPYEILNFIGRGTSMRDYQRLKAALDRLQTTSVAPSIRQSSARRAFVSCYQAQQRPAKPHVATIYGTPNDYNYQFYELIITRCQDDDLWISSRGRGPAAKPTTEASR